MSCVLRVDAGSETGMGHLIRMHALSQAMGQRQVECRFVTASKNAEKWMRAQGLKGSLLHVAAASSADSARVLEYADRVNARWVVTDGRHFEERYLNALMEGGIPTVSIDDMGKTFFPTTLVVNGGLAAESLNYRVSPTTKVLLGPEYLILRPPFAERAPRKVSDVRQMLVCFGGADPEDYTGRVLDFLAAWKGLPENIEVTAVVGPAYPRMRQLTQSAASRGVRVCSDIDANALAQLMSRSDLAITSAGMVACEAAAIGMASLLVVIAEDQVLNATALVSKGAARRVESFDADHVVGLLEEVLPDRNLRQSMVDAAMDLVDGLGCGRVADAILSIK